MQTHLEGEKVDWWVPGAWRREKEDCLTGRELQFYKVRRFMDTNGGDGCTTMSVYLTPLNWLLND